MNYAVSTSKLCKSYDNSLIVKDCAIRVRKGSIYGLLGANGAGKTTIFKMLSGLISPTSGDAEILGLNVVTSRVEIQKNIGIVIDVPVFYENLSATENIKLHLSYMGKKADVKKTLETVGLDDTGKRPVAKLSLGMRQRLAIARAIVHQPELLILDEPTNGLDPIGIRQMRELFVFLVKERGISIIISSHILTEIQHVCDNIGMIAKGEIVRQNTMNEIKEQHGSLEEYYMKVIGGVQ